MTNDSAPASIQAGWVPGGMTVAPAGDTAVPLYLWGGKVTNFRPGNFPPTARNWLPALDCSWTVRCAGESDRTSTIDSTSRYIFRVSRI